MKEEIRCWAQRSLGFIRSVNNPRMVSLYGSTQVQLVMLHLHFPWESFVVRQAFLFTITNHTTRYHETLVTRWDSATWRRRTFLCEATVGRTRVNRRGEEVGASSRSKRFLKRPAPSKLPWGVQRPGALETEENTTRADTPNNVSRAP